MLDKFFVCLLGLIISLAKSSYASKAPTPHIEDNLVIISPHLRSLQEEISSHFITWYQENYKRNVNIKWLYQGGTDDLKFILTRFQQSPKRASSGIDLLWGGGELPHLELEKQKILQSYKLPTAIKKNIPSQIANVKIYNQNENWHASALTSFGLFFNKRVLQLLKIKEPKTWEDLAHESFFEQISTADLRHSSSNVTMSLVILEALGWEKGWQLLTKIAINTRSFTHSSADPIKHVVHGDVAASLSVGFYAKAQIGDLGADSLGYVSPEGKNIINADPISILKGAPNLLVAKRFVNFLLDTKAQKLFLLPKGAVGGPKKITLGRMAVNQKAYQETMGKRIDPFNPHTQKSTYLDRDLKKHTKLQTILPDLIGSLHIDLHRELKEAWAKIAILEKKDSKKAKELWQKLSLPPISEKTALELSQRWTDGIIRNSMINQWMKSARCKYKNIAS